MITSRTLYRLAPNHLTRLTFAYSRFTTSPHFLVGPRKCSFARDFRTSAFRAAPLSNPGSTHDIFHVHKWNTRTKVIAAVIGGGSVYYLYHLERAPVTGRLRFMDVSPKQESSLAAQGHQQLLLQFQGKILPQNHLLSRHVRRIVSRILEGSHLGRVSDAHEPTSFEEISGNSWSDGLVTDGQKPTEFSAVDLARDWKVLVINDDSVMNAAVINGTVVIFTGILPLCKDENGLAAVIGHEIAHVLARHTAERISSSRLLTALAYILGQLLGIDENLSQLVMTYALQLPNSRTQELEADKIGLTLTAQACYDPQTVPDMQQRLAILEAKAPKGVEFLQTHPSSARRAEILESYLPDAYALQAASSFCAGMASQLGSFKEAVAAPWSSPPNEQKSSEWLS